MTQQATGIAAASGITVEAPRERAFAVFTEGFASWWPASHHIGEQDPETVVLEQRAGGRWFERAADGTECEWGRVLAYDPPSSLLLSWQLDGEWKYDPDPGHASEIEVRFISEGADRTRVEIEHRNLERHGAAAESIRAAVSSEEGWPGILARYAEVVRG